MEKKDVNGRKEPPSGLQAIINECLKIYPDQPNPLQVATVVKYWYVSICVHIRQNNFNLTLNSYYLSENP